VYRALRPGSWLLFDSLDPANAYALHTTSYPRAKCMFQIRRWESIEPP
jgi:hypothetical protein